jgi:hypothetical protein
MNFLKEIHTIYLRRWSSEEDWDFSDSIPDTRGLNPATKISRKRTMVGQWDWLISALLQTHGISLEEESNISRFKLLFSSYPFPGHQVSLQFVHAEKSRNWYQLDSSISITVMRGGIGGKLAEGQLNGLKFRLSHNTAIFWFNTNPRYIYLKSELLEEESKNYIQHQR